MLLAQAEEAYRAGHGGEANAMLRDVTVNQFLTPADKERHAQVERNPTDASR